MKNFIVTHKYHGKKLNIWFQENLSHLNKNVFYKTLRKKDIKINDKRIHEDTVIFEGDKISVYLSDSILIPHTLLDIFYEDAFILILYKPFNLEVIGENSLTSIVHEQYSHQDFLPMPCHRLDRNTCGLILYAKTKQALDLLFEKFKMHEIEKHYLAWVYGIPNQKSKTITSYLFKDQKKAKVYISNEWKKGYQKIITSYTIRKSDKETSLLDIEIETGKTHQIRAHLAYIGYPIIGDRKIWKK